MTPPSRYILTVSCPDTIGIVAAISSYLRDLGCFITESADYGDPEAQHFFLRVVFDPITHLFSEENFIANFQPIADEFVMQWTLHNLQIKRRVLILVSKYDHCLNDLLFRYRTGSLPMEIPAIVSNHTDLEKLAAWHDIPFHHIPVTPQTKLDAEQKLLALIEKTNADTIVLARYMQILSPDLCTKLNGQIINIHHSFLPSFKGAKPYHMAFERGVKLIGATAHYVTPDLDEGPIIEQHVERVEHFHKVENMSMIGRDVECRTLARALQYHLENRVFLHGRRTIIFRR